MDNDLISNFCFSFLQGSGKAFCALPPVPMAFSRLPVFILFFMLFLFFGL